VPEAGTLEALARRARVGIYPLDAAGVAASDSGASLLRRAVVLGYASLTPRQIADGIARLSDAVDDRLDRHHEFLHELLVHEPRRPTPAPAARHPAPSIGDWLCAPSSGVGQCWAAMQRSGITPAWPSSAASIAIR
jgi:GntR family transcriptional regulator/MocR family aminotransferase